MDLKERKRKIRKEVLALRSKLGEGYRREASAKIVAEILSFERFKEAKRVFAFVPFGDEVDLKPVIEACWKGNKELFVPRVDPLKGSMEFYLVERWEDLEVGHFGILEPKKHSAHYEGGEIGLVLMPGVAFDLRKGRLGYGKGYYDRYLSRMPFRPYLLGAAFQIQIVQEVPREPWDQGVDAVVTERGWIF